MATTKEYGYYIEGNQIAIVQRDTSFNNDLTSHDFGPGSDKWQWKSPLESIDVGLELQYTYSPEYKELNQGSRVSSQPVSYKGAAATNKLRLDLSDDIDWSTKIGSYILLLGAGRWNGVHKIMTSSITNVIYTDTHYPDAANVSILFETGIKYSLNVSILEDESYVIDLPIYLQKALVYYIKSKLFEDMGDMKMREYMYREFSRQIEKHNNGKIPGLRLVTAGFNAIK